MRFYLWVISVVQAACLIVILYCSWLLLDTPLFALVAASLVLAMTLHIENRTVVIDATSESSPES